LAPEQRAGAVAGDGCHRQARRRLDTIAHRVREAGAASTIRVAADMKEERTKRAKKDAA